MFVGALHRRSHDPHHSGPARRVRSRPGRRHRVPVLHPHLPHGGGGGGPDPPPGGPGREVRKGGRHVRRVQARPPGVRRGRRRALRAPVRCGGRPQVREHPHPEGPRGGRQRVGQRHQPRGSPRPQGRRRGGRGRARRQGRRGRPRDEGRQRGRRGQLRAQGRRRRARPPPGRHRAARQRPRVIEAPHHVWASPRVGAVRAMCTKRRRGNPPHGSFTWITADRAVGGGENETIESFGKTPLPSPTSVH